MKKFEEKCKMLTETEIANLEQTIAADTTEQVADLLDFADPSSTEKAADDGDASEGDDDSLAGAGVEDGSFEADDDDSEGSDYSGGQETGVEPVSPQSADANSNADLALQVKQLQEQLAKLLDKSTPDSDIEPEAEESKVKPDNKLEIDFVDEDQWTDALTSREGFNKILNVMFNSMTQATAQMMQPVITQTAETAIQRAEAVKDFYRANPDLANAKPMVRSIANDVIREKGEGVDASAFFKEVAKRTREAIGRVNAPKPAKAAQARNPGFMQTRNARTGSATPSNQGEIAAQIRDLLL
jgi:hypothetical protein